MRAFRNEDPRKLGKLSIFMLNLMKWRRVVGRYNWTKEYDVMVIN
jgi:hypothetical protein